MAPPPGVRPRANLRGFPVALAASLVLWAFLVLAGWIAFALFGPVGVVALAACLVYLWVLGMGWLS